MTGAAGIGYDLLSVANALNIAATPGNLFAVGLHSLLASNPSGEVASFDATADHSYTLVSTSGAISGFAANKFALDTAGFTNVLYGGQWFVMPKHFEFTNFN